ncbi:hypothetical protein [Parasitella parasitica]|uniref:UDENN FLCN/SMCR8-type domain-containing protein n=1 Tax=Parasitella parasitica TaxID=35722 RepID=A0A0B7NI20_9FUNG|nr:hypothetical protein [Parasitella parasitica]
MNAIVALLHFCEVHGPCVVYCTQAIHSNSPSVNENENCNASPPISILQSKHPAALMQQQASSISTAPSLASLRKNSSSSLNHIAASASVSPPTTAAQAATSTAPSTTCAACTAQLPLINNGTSITEAKRLVTTDDDDPTIQYIGTSKCPQQPHLYKAVRLACVRSLTAEFCQGRDGPVLFGDDENGHVMSYMFKLRDAQARGEARFYALMMLMTDRVYLVSCWPLLVGAFRSMALNLQERANIVFQREKESMRQITHRRAPITSQDQFYRRRSHTALRSLVDLLGIKKVGTLQSIETAAKLARKIVSDAEKKNEAGRGHILTTMDESVSEEFRGFPFGIMEYYSDKCTPNGNLLLFMSDLQMSARNMHRHMDKVAFTVTSLQDYNPGWHNQSTPVQQPRFTLFGSIERVPESKAELAMNCFTKTHEEARPWKSFHDFHFYEFQVKGIYYVGGFGGLNYIGWIPVDLYRAAGLRGLVEQ